MDEDIELVNNNTPQEEPAPSNDITIKFDPALQAALVEFDNRVYRSYEYVLGVLEMAKLTLMQQRAMAQAMAMQAQQVNAHQAREIGRSLGRKF